MTSRLRRSVSLYVRILAVQIQAVLEYQSDFVMNGLGNLLLGGTLIGIGLSHLHLHWTAGKIAFAVLLLVSACATKVALNMATCSSAFWTQGGFNPLAFLLHQMGDMARYP